MHRLIHRRSAIIGMIMLGGLLFIAIFAPVLFMLVADPIVLGVTMGLVLQTAYLTPPFGFAIFYLQGTTDQLETVTIYRGVRPFILVQVLLILFILLFPDFITWLPGMLQR